VGASIAFDAALNKYRREEYILLAYHVHIPLPDPMVNPATLARQQFYGVRSSPSYFVDGEASGGGGSADGAKALFESRIDPMIAKHMDEAPEAAIELTAQPDKATVKVKTTVSKVASTSDKLRLQIALVEGHVRYSGENGTRFHDMVVRTMAAPPASATAGKKPESGEAAAGTPGTVTPTLGFALKPGQGGTFEYTFDLAKAAADALTHLQDFETITRKGQYSFRQKKHEIDPSKLSVVAFVQDEATKKILQAVYVKVEGK
jgi:hypothetical protein